MCSFERHKNTLLYGANGGKQVKIKANLGYQETMEDKSDSSTVLKRQVKLVKTKFALESFYYTTLLNKLLHRLKRSIHVWLKQGKSMKMFFLQIAYQ